MVVAWTMTLVDCGVTRTDLDCMVWDIREREEEGRAERGGRHASGAGKPTGRRLVRQNKLETCFCRECRGGGGAQSGATGPLFLARAAALAWFGFLAEWSMAQDGGGGLRVLPRGHSFSRGAAVWT